MNVARDQWLTTFELAGVPAFLYHLGEHRPEIISCTTHFSALLSPAGDLEEAELLERLASAPPAAGDAQPVVVHGTGTPAWHCAVQPIDEEALRYLAILRLPTAAQLLNDSCFALVENLPDVVSRYDRNLRHLYVNRALDNLTAPTTAQNHIGKDHRELKLPEYLTTLLQSAYRTVFTTGEAVQQDFEYPTADGPRHFVFRTVPEYGPDGEIRTILNTAREITELKALQRELEALAQTDSLTSLLNRRSFVERVENELLEVRAGQSRLSLLLLDVDDFKSVNDRFGHRAGDTVLMAIAEVLREETGPQGFAGRIGGDEFCVGLIDAHAEGRQTAERIRQRIGELDESHGCATGVSVSIGLTTADHDDLSVPDLISRVDRLMYQEKSRTGLSRATPRQP